MIIDNGNTNNFVSIENLKKMELETTAHRKPYKVLCLQKGHQMMVSRKCNVEFKIRGYTDEIMCDVIPMDIFHFFSGIQWQYNINVIHDGQKNTYPLRRVAIHICCFQWRIRN
jgi:hypothetical protein